jgi:hypothetical protein
MTTSDPTPEQDECRIVEVDGEAIRVQASGEWTTEDHAAFAEIVRAAKKHMRAEQIGES